MIDADLRRGALREQFNSNSRFGFSEVLRQEVPWSEVIMPTAYGGLFLLTRGKPLTRPGEDLLWDSTDQFFRDIHRHYDHIIIDSRPVLAGDDTTNLAPKLDATLLIARLSHTSARLTKKALQLLYSRQVDVPGIILNFVDTSRPEYYQYSEYYTGR